MPLSMERNYRKSTAYEIAQKVEKAEYDRFNILIQSMGGLAKTFSANFGALSKILTRRK